MKKIMVLLLIGIFLTTSIGATAINCTQETKQSVYAKDTTFGEPNIYVKLVPKPEVISSLSDEALKEMLENAEIKFVPITIILRIRIPDYEHSFTEDLELIDGEYVASAKIDGRYLINAINIARNTNNEYRGTDTEINLEANDGIKIVTLNIEKKPGSGVSYPKEMTQFTKLFRLLDFFRTISLRT